jgi:L,D-transpeptidase YcbB
MRYFITLIIGLFVYLGCANKSSRVITPEESIELAIENEILLESWDYKENRIATIEAIRNASNEGLNPEDYHYSQLVKYEDSIILTPSETETYHKLLTESIIKYTSHLRNGKINPLEIYDDWEIKPKPILNDSLLTQILIHKKIDSLIESSKPKHLIYKNLKKGLLHLNTMPEEHFDTIKLIEKTIFGVKNKTVEKIKKRLRYWGDIEANDTLANNHYNEAFKKFQQRNGLVADGKIGPGTLKFINISKETRKQQIIANLERWRWFPEEFGENYLGVNLPDYMLQVVENNDTVTTYKVVIGQVKRKTPILSSKVDNIVFNPTWTIPPTIIKEDLIPDATKSKSYFYKTRVKIFNYKNKEVSVRNWKPEDALTYKYVQDPGYNNALGVVKINFENDHLVYMHDTNHRELFVNHYRALSSGCVRIEKPLPLAAYLLKDKLKKEKVKEDVIQKGKKKPITPIFKTKLVEVPVYSLPEIDTIVQTKKTKAVKVSQNFNIHFLYFTAWYDKGKFNFRNDVYNYDPELYLRLSNQFTGNLVTSSRVIDK